MSTISDVEHYLAGRARVEQAARAKAGSIAEPPFICLSRQTGAGGRTLAGTLLEVMALEPDVELFGGWQILDRQLCEQVLGNSNLRDSIRSLLNEDYRSQIGEFVLGLFGSQQPQDSAMRDLSEVIRSLATLGRVIVVGRGGTLATKGLPYGLRMRLVAPEAVRVQRMAKLLDKDEKESLALVREHDRERARLMKNHFLSAIDDPLLYDAVWNTDSLGMESIATAVVDLIKSQVRRRVPE